MTTNITKSYSITISPMTRCEYTFMATKYTLDVPYVVVVQGRKSGKEIQLHGVWSGVDYSETRMEVKKYDITTSELHDVEIVDL